MIKKLTSCLMAVVMVLTVLSVSVGAYPAYVQTRGRLGDLTYFLDDNGHASVSGTGAMGFDLVYWNALAAPYIISCTIEPGCISISDQSFWKLRNMTDVIIPNSVVSIESGSYTEDIDDICIGAFSESGITHIEIPDKVTEIGDYTFGKCIALSNVKLPANLTTIGSGAFKDCVALSELELPSGVETIGHDAFVDCIGLTKITIPKSVTYIDNTAFDGCDSLTIYGVSGTFAESFARDHQIPFVAIGSGGAVEDPDYDDGSVYIKFSSDEFWLTKLGYPDYLFVTYVNYTGNMSDISIDIKDDTIAHIENVSYTESGVVVGLIADALGSTEINFSLDGELLGSADVICRPSNSEVTFLAKEVAIHVDDEIDIIANVANYPMNSPGSADFGITDGTIIAKTKTVTKATKDNNVISFHHTIKGLSEGISEIQYVEGGYLMGSCKIHVFPEGAELPDFGESNADKFYVQVLRKAGNLAVPFPGVKVKIPCMAESDHFTNTLNTITVLTNDDGFCYIDKEYLVTKGEISVEKEGFISQTKQFNLNSNNTPGAMGNEGITVVLEAESTEPKITKITFTDSTDIYDILNNDKYIYVGDVSEQTNRIDIQAKIYDGNRCRISIIQDQNVLCRKIIDANDGLVECSFTERFNSILIPNKDVFIVVETSGGSETVSSGHLIPKTKLFNDSTHGKDNFEMSLDGDKGKGKVEIPKEVPILGNMELSVDLPKFPAQIVYDDDGSIVITIGFDDFDENKESVSDYMYRTSQEWEEIKYDFGRLGMYKNMYHGYKGAYDLAKEVKVDFNLKGYGKKVADKNGNAIVQVDIIAEMEIKGKHGTEIMFGYIPVYVEASLSSTTTAELGAGISYLVDDFFDSLQIKPRGELSEKIKLSLYGGMGFGKVISLGGSVDGDLTIKYVFHESHLTITATVGANLEAHAFAFHAKKELASRKWELVDEQGETAALNDMALYLSTYNALRPDDFELLDRNYGQESLLTLGDALLSYNGAAISNSSEVIAENVYPYADCRIVSVNGAEYLFRLADDSNRTISNRSVLVCQVNDSNGWSKPVIINDDGTGDYNFDVCVDGSDIYIAWTNTDAALAGETDLLAVAKTTDVSVAKIDTVTGNVIILGSVGEQDIGDLMPVISVQNGKGIVLWSCNSENNVFQTTGTNSLRYAEIDNNSLSAANTYTSERGLIPSYDVSMVGGAIVVAFIEDTDGDYNTFNDLEVFASRIDSVPQKITSDDSIDNSVAFADNNGDTYLIWYHDGNIAYSEGISSNYKTAFDNYIVTTDDLKIVESDNGIIVAWEGKNAYDSNKLDIFATVFDGSFSEPKVIDTLDKTIFDLAVYSEANGSLNYVDVTSEDGVTYTLEQAREREIKSINVIDVAFDQKNVIPGTTLPIKVTVINTGNTIVSDPQFKVDSINGTLTIKNIQNADIKPGETVEIYAEMDIPSISEAANYTLSVNGFDAEYVFVMGYTDLELTACKYYSDELTLIDVNIKNISQVSTSAKLNIYVDDEIVSTKVIDEITPSAVKTLVVNINSISNDKYNSVKFELIADSEELYTFNNTSEIINTRFYDSIPNLTYIIVIPDNVLVTRDGINLENGAIINNGDKLLIKSTPPTGYKLSSLKVNGTTVADNSEYTVNGSDVNIEVSFAKSSGSTGSSTGNSSSGNSRRPISSGSSIIPVELASGQTGWTKVLEEINISNAGDTVIVTLNYETYVPANIFKALSDRRVVLKMIADANCAWIVNGEDIISLPTGSVDFSVDSIYTNIPKDILKEIPGSSTTLHIRSNSLSSIATMCISGLKDNSQKTAYIYKFDNETGKIKLITAKNILSNGELNLDCLSDGDYIILYAYMGDVNNDGFVNSIDAAMILQYAVGSFYLKYPEFGDMNSDGSSNSLDAALILKKVVGLI